MQKIKQHEKSVYSKIALTKTLTDKRRDKYGMKFGKVSDVATQYGIKIKMLSKC